MPALPAVPGVIKVTCQFTQPGNPNCISRFYLHYSGTAPTPAQLATFCTAVGTNFSSNMAGLMSVNNTLQSVSAEDLSSSTGAVASQVVNVAGTRTGASLPNATACMIQYFIARRYRGGKPKGFWPLGVGTDISAGSWVSSTFLVPVGTDYGNFQTALASAGWAGAGTITNVNVSYYQGFTVVTNPITHRSRNVPTLRGAPVVDTITSYGVEPGIAAQRRRNVV